MSQTGTRIRVVVADDSLVAREMLAQILASDPAIEVVGLAADGSQAVELVERLRPDLVTMDIHMPKMDGLEATEHIMAYRPTPILVVSSSVHGQGIGRAFDALSAGALDVVKKPEPRDWKDLEHIGRDIIGRVQVLARVKVVTHIRGRQGERAAPGSGESKLRRSLVAIGSSTGGPSALHTILAQLPRDLPACVLVAQHIAEGFVPGLVAWLRTGSELTIKPADNDDPVEPGVVYVAPTGRNMVVQGNVLRLREPEPGQLYLPCVDALMETVADTYGGRAVGVILTGMGSDGALGLKRLRDSGGATIAQDGESSTVWGMPKAAIELGAAQKVLSVDDIADELKRLVLGA